MNKVIKTGKKLIPLWRGLAAGMLTLTVVATAGYGIADTWRSQIDSALNTQSYIISDASEARFAKQYKTPEEMMAAARAHSVLQGEEGLVVMKNDNGALPIKDKTKKIALFGAAAWKPYMQSTGDLKAGNADAVNLDDAFVNAGYTLEPTMQTIYKNVLADSKTASQFGNVTVTYVHGYVGSPGDMKDYTINECPPDQFANAHASDNYDDEEWLKAHGFTDRRGNLDEKAIAAAKAGLESAPEVPSNWKETLSAGKANQVGIVAFARGAGESNTYAPGSAVNYAGEKTGKDPLALSEDELAIVDLAKETCDKVIVLINSGNNMELGEIAKGGAHEVDAICYMGVINDYQCEGIVNVLTGKANATGALSDTYVYSNANNPAIVNFGGDEYADPGIAASAGTDPRWPDKNIGNGTGSDFGGGAAASSYSGNSYLVEAEGIYVGYKYYETRYYDAIVNPNSKANSSKGSLSGAWDYSKEVVYSFGHGLSYLDYTQKLVGIEVDRSTEGNITATIEVNNKGTEKGKFLTQLYVQQPYTQYDVTNKVEKSAVMFLSSKKVEVAAGATETVKITVPTKYLASYDYTNAKTYILDAGDYYFTAAAGAHEAVNNILTEQRKTGDAAGKGTVKVWNLGSFDSTTFSTNNGKQVTNVADNADLNYWLPNTVTYLSRNDWEGTYPVNYNKVNNGGGVSIAASAKKDEWIKEIRGQQAMLTKGTEEARNVDGADLGLKLDSEHLGNLLAKGIDDEIWDRLVAQISVNEAVGAVIHGGGQSDTLKYVDNPVVGQNEGVNGIKGSIKSTDETKEYHFNINSQTLLGTSFNPELAYEWGLLQGESGLWLQKQAVWGTGLTLRRTAYNGRNYEYISEDPMLSNVIGYGIGKGTAEKGLVCGPKHMGFNDQEHNRSGIAAYINEQKMRETDLRAFQGFLEDGGGLAVMVAFNRIGATNASHHQGMLKTILREEWGFNGVVSTDLAGAPYFAAESMIMATVTQRAEFGGNNSYLSKDGNPDEVDSTYPNLSINSCKMDPVLVEQARQNLKYQLYTFAHSAVMNIVTTRVTPWWESTLVAVIAVTAVIGGLSAAAWLAFRAIPSKEEE